MYSDSNDEVKGFHDNDTNDIYINLDNADNTDDIIKTIGHETAHNNTKDEMVAKNTENFASRMNSFKELINFAGKRNSNNEIIKHHITRENWTQEQYRDAVKNFIKEERQGLRNGDTDLNSVNRHNPSIKD